MSPASVFFPTLIELKLEMWNSSDIKCLALTETNRHRRHEQWPSQPVGNGDQYSSVPFFPPHWHRGNYWQQISDWDSLRAHTMLMLTNLTIIALVGLNVHVLVNCYALQHVETMVQCWHSTWPQFAVCIRLGALTNSIDLDYIYLYFHWALSDNVYKNLNAS